MGIEYKRRKNNKKNNIKNENKKKIEQLTVIGFGGCAFEEHVTETAVLSRFGLTHVPHVNFISPQERSYVFK